MHDADGLRFAVVFKAYNWDDFVLRQAARLASVCGGGAFFIALDETNGTIADVPFARVFRTTEESLIGAGFADRREAGSLLWWNPDYVHYAFAERYPEYDYVIFAEYDVTVHGDLTSILMKAASLQADMVGLPIPGAWFWRLPHRQTYALGELCGALACFSIFSRRALRLLARRRREMAAGAQTRYWPSSEAFMATEIGRAGYKLVDLAELGDVSRYAFFPPILEQDLERSGGPSFMHPVLDKPRYIASLLKSTNGLWQYFAPWSVLRRTLARFPRQDYRTDIMPAFRRRLVIRLGETLQRARLRLHSRSLRS